MCESKTEEENNLDGEKRERLIDTQRMRSENESVSMRGRQRQRWWMDEQPLR